MLCRDIGPGAGDNTFLQWYDFVADRLDRLPLLGAGGWLLAWRCAVVAGAALLGVLLVRRKARRPLALAALALCALCYAGEWRINRWTYGVDAAAVQAASSLNESLKTLEGAVLFIPNGVRGRDSQLIDTYIDRDVYLCEYENAMPVGSVYHTYMTETDFHKIPKELRAIAMLRCLIVPDRHEKEVEQVLEEYDPALDGGLTAEQKDALVQKREADGIHSLKKDSNGFTASLNAREDGYVLFTVPYDDGFRAQVNGEPVQILESNGMMAVPAEKGENRIRFIWKNHDLMAGTACTVCGTLLWALYIWLENRRIEKKRL